MLRLAILPFEKINTPNLESIARTVVPNGVLRQQKRSEVRYRSYLAGRCAVKFLFSQINASYQVSPNSLYGFLEVQNNNQEKVSGMYVNISHTDQVSVAAISNSAVGVDVESRSRSAERVLTRVATDAEREWVKDGQPINSPLKIGKDIFLWSAKEAASKAVGLGMKFGLQMFEIFPSENDLIFTVRSKCKGPLELTEPAIYFESWENYFITISAERSSISRGIDGRIIGPRELEVLR